MKTAILHLGIHKTATTYIQSRLENSILSLKEQGVLYIPLAQTREQITSKLNRDTFDTKTLQFLLAQYPEHQRLIISDENILGSSRVKDNRLYSKFEHRIKKFISMLELEGYNIEYHITIRNYNDFLISRYSEFLRHNAFLTFEKYYKYTDFDHISWQILCKDLLNIEGITHLHVTPFESLFQNEQAYFTRLIGSYHIKLNTANNDPATKRAKLTQQAYQMVKSFSQIYSNPDSNKIVTFLDSIKQQTPVTAFTPFSKEKTRQLFKQYESDLISLSENKEKITIYKPYQTILSLKY